MTVPAVGTEAHQQVLSQQGVRGSAQWPWGGVQKGLLDVGPELLWWPRGPQSYKQEVPDGPNQSRMGSKVGLAEAPEPLCSYHFPARNNVNVKMSASQ